MPFHGWMEFTDFMPKVNGTPVKMWLNTNKSQFLAVMRMDPGYTVVIADAERFTKSKGTDVKIIASVDEKTKDAAMGTARRYMKENN